MRSKVVVAGTVATVVAGTVLTVSAAQGERAAPRITVVEHAVSDALVDLAPDGDSAGDLLTFANPVYDRTNSRKVGRDQGSCIRTVVGKAWQCSFTTWLGKGSLTVEGPFYDAHPSVMAITGGTGAFSRARGVMHLAARNSQGTAFTFRFVIR
jgi:hypothetical protein